MALCEMAAGWRNKMDLTRKSGRKEHSRFRVVFERREGDDSS